MKMHECDAREHVRPSEMALKPQTNVPQAVFASKMSVGGGRTLGSG